MRNPILKFTQRLFSAAALRCFLLALAIALQSSLPAPSQTGGARGFGQTQPIGQPALGPMDAGTWNNGSYALERQLRFMNAARQKELVSDTNKLLKLVMEYDSEIGRENPTVLTASQLRKLAEIERLARSVKDKMSTSVRGVPGFLQPSGPPLR